MEDWTGVEEEMDLSLVVLPVLVSTCLSDFDLWSMRAEERRRGWGGRDGDLVREEPKVQQQR